MDMVMEAMWIGVEPHVGTIAVASSSGVATGTIALTPTMGVTLSD